MLNRHESPLANWPKWADREWALGQLRNHLFEVGHLLAKADPHFEAELADLAIIAGWLADPEMVKARLGKFAEKANLPKA
jgi:hypothetical protein